MIAVILDYLAALLIYKKIKNKWLGVILTIPAGIAVDIVFTTTIALISGVSLDDRSYAVALIAGIIKQPVLVLVFYLITLTVCRLKKRAPSEST